MYFDSTKAVVSKGPPHLFLCLVITRETVWRDGNPDGWHLSHVTMGGTDLHRSVVGQVYEMVQDVLEQDPSMVDAKDSNGWTPLHEAVARESEDIVKLLVEDGDADVNAFNDEGRTVLGVALEYHGIDHPMVDLLLSLEATTEAHVFAAEQNYDMLKECLERQPLFANFEDVSGWTPLHEAVREPSEAIVRLLIEKGSGKC
jgi:ankyrin repeat protein